LRAFDGAAELVEAHRLAAQQQQDQHRPFVADPVEDLARRAIGGIGVRLQAGGFHRVTPA